MVERVDKCVLAGKFLFLLLVGICGTSEANSVSSDPRTPNTLLWVCFGAAIGAATVAIFLAQTYRRLLTVRECL
ncbi:MAG: hypothetical protein FJ147_12020 [Deltaproteobacteria bacterium]|nr:hypothetical protein [Deltaproteobacteria bacterium]